MEKEEEASSTTCDSACNLGHKFNSRRTRAKERERERERERWLAKENSQGKNKGGYVYYGGGGEGLKTRGLFLLELVGFPFRARKEKWGVRFSSRPKGGRNGRS